jgi:predicted DNA-binding transcriptional regulator YafY
VRRRLDPLGLVLKAGTWYLVARHRNEVRTYRIGRVRRCSVRTEAVERPTDFDLAAWWATSSAEFDRSILRARCQLALSPRAQRRLVRVTDTEAARRALAGGRPDARRDGWVVVELECESSEVVASQLVGIADGVEVLDPPTLRRRLHEIGRVIAELNGSSDGRP